LIYLIFKLLIYTHNKEYQTPLFSTAAVNMQYKALTSVALALATASGFAEGSPVSSSDQLEVVKRGTATIGGNPLEYRRFRGWYSLGRCDWLSDQYTRMS
jgi:hypothetical protein